MIGLILVNNLLDIQLLATASLALKIGTFVACIAFGSLVLGKKMKYIFNSPEMHIWHHSYDLPEERRFGINFGLTLAIWDYMFKTAYIPHSGQDIRLGFPGIEEFPEDFKNQMMQGFSSSKE